MNYRLVFKIIGKTMLIAAALLLVPVIVALVYKETDKLSAFIIPAAALCAIGAVPSCIKIKERSYGAKEGFVIVALCWLLLSFVGCVPFIVSGEIPGLADAFSKRFRVLPRPARACLTTWKFYREALCSGEFSRTG